MRDFLVPVRFLLFRFGFFIFFSSFFVITTVLENFSLETLSDLEFFELMEFIFDLENAFDPFPLGLVVTAGLRNLLVALREALENRLLMTAGRGEGVGAKLGGVLVPYSRSTQR